MKNLIIKTDAKNIEVKACLDEVIDYNEEYGFVDGDDEFIPSWIGANVIIDIGDSVVSGQVQWDAHNQEYSIDCDGNTFYSDVKNALLSNFTHDELFTAGTNELNNSVYEIESDLHCDLLNNELPKIAEFICNFGGEAIKEFKKL